MSNSTLAQSNIPLKQNGLQSKDPVSATSKLQDTTKIKPADSTKSGQDTTKKKRQWIAGGSQHHRSRFPKIGSSKEY
ncbi:hypothetical protein KUH03_09980 [Sphingobacterium sp. E70]|uniref:hypothetical protein n=1 Tax=Sphingobacterium sp. E70 TaxID=2853439 RepID=UPI00211C6F56|nr:hypothetical protein [Sphingobacterium sp. E70]ULT27073.1 hypothetical protein KUH03_09980 [Sphingobacterium sp. E70]